MEEQLEKLISETQDAAYGIAVEEATRRGVFSDNLAFHKILAGVNLKLLQKLQKDAVQVVLEAWEEL